MPITKMTDEQKLQATERYKAGEILSTIANDCNVTPSTILHYIKKNGLYVKRKRGGVYPINPNTKHGVYPVLSELFIENRVSRNEISTLCNKSKSWCNFIFSGKIRLTIDDAIIIYRHLNTDIPMETLFERVEQNEQNQAQAN